MRLSVLRYRLRHPNPNFPLNSTLVANPRPSNEVPLYTYFAVPGLVIKAFLTPSLEMLHGEIVPQNVNPLCLKANIIYFPTYLNSIAVRNLQNHPPPLTAQRWLQ